MEEVLDLESGQATELNNSSLFTNPKAHQIILPRDMSKEFYEDLKKLLEKTPGEDDLELVIGNKVLPLPIKAKWSDGLQAQINEMIDR